MSNEQICFIGLDGMGSGVVMNLVANSECPVTVSDLDTDKVDATVKNGALRGENMLETAAYFSIVAVCVTTTEVVQ